MNTWKGRAVALVIGSAAGLLAADLFITQTAKATEVCERNACGLESGQCFVTDVNYNCSLKSPAGSGCSSSAC